MGMNSMRKGGAMRCKYFIIILMCIILRLLVISPTRGWSESLDIRVFGGNNDAEERLSDGDMSRGSSDLELVRDPSRGNQLVGIRFRNVAVPQGSVITNAYIEFETDERDSEATNLLIKGEAADDTDRFENPDRNISRRPTTSASVSWNNVPAWNTVNEKHQTPNLSSVVQEIVDRLGWTSGNSMVFIISGSGRRTAKSYNGDWDAAPLLHLEYQTDTTDIRVSRSSDDAEEDESDGGMTLNSDDLDMIRDWDGTEYSLGLRFQNVDVPRGAIVTNAYIEFETADTWSGRQTDPTDLTITGEAHDNAPTFTNTQEDITLRSGTHSAVSWNNIPEWNTEHERHHTPDLSAIAQEIVGRSGWSNGNAMVFIIKGSGCRIAKSYDEGASVAPLFHIEYTEESFPYISVDKNILGAVCTEGSNPPDDSFIITNSGSDILSFTISDDADWLSCSPETGDLSPGESVTISVGFSAASMDAGTHEATITVADTDAYNSPLEIDVSLTVSSLPVSSACGHIPVYAENLVYPAILVLLDLSGSMGNLMSISDPGENPRTPDLKSIVQEIVDRSGWASGNAMVFIITGSGQRTAESYDGSSGKAPLLHIAYTYSGTYEIDIRVSQRSDDAEEESDGDVSVRGNDLDLIRDRGTDQTVGIRFQDVSIPKGAIITNAYIEFVVSQGQSEATSLTIRGEDLDNPPTFARRDRNITNRTTTDASVSWNNIPEWQIPTRQSRIDIARSVISELVKDKSIAWGFGTWRSRDTAGYTSSIDYTKIHVGCKPNDPNHQAKLQESIISDTTVGGSTPFGPSINAAKKYFLGEKKDNEGSGEYYVDISCQPKFLIDLTDGIGNVDSTDTIIRGNTGALCDEGVTPIAVGFGIDDATQIQIMARVSNERGHASTDLYALHNEVDGIGQPFLAYSKDALMEALSTITERIKGQIFHGAAPVPTTSSDHGDIVIVAEFDATDWSGDLVASRFNPSTKEWDIPVWRASEAMPMIRNLFTIDPSDPNSVIPYTDGILSNDNWICKDIGDIINSTPIIVGSPPFYYDFDGYERWKKGIAREPLIYVGANDGSLHVFNFSDGVEQWAFFPKSSHEKLDKADDPLYDLCGNDYCHQYFVDGSPQVGDIYTGTSWMTILVCGLREGGESYFALDITHGKHFRETNGARFLWEFTDAELGQTWADPCIERIRYGSEATWGVFFGSGYSSSDQANKEGYLYGIEAHNKAPLWRDGTDDINRIKISGSTLKDDALSSPVAADLDGDYIGDRIFTGNLYGTMYRIKDIGKGETPMISKLFDFENTSHINPIRAKATYAYGVEYGHIWVYFGSGRFETQMDKTSMDQQYFFGLKETPGGTHTYKLDELVRLNVRTIEYTDPNTYEIQPVKVIEGVNPSNASWAVLLDNSSPGMVGSERVIEQPLVVAGIVYFTTFTPDQDLCAGSGDTWIYALEYDTGRPPITPVFDLNDDGLFDDRDKVIDSLGVVYNVAAIQVGSGQGSAPILHKETLFVGTTNEDVTALNVNLPKSKARITSWRDNTL
ncbi:MAG: PilC/PilY family type IV pilus protein [bacterium]